MGEVARSLGITTVYYSEVENSKKPPFAPDQIDFTKMASILNLNQSLLDELEDLAITVRGKVGVDLRSSDPRTRQVVRLVARRAQDNSLSEEQLSEIENILRRDGRGAG
jgi:hypothetical protein